MSTAEDYRTGKGSGDENFPVASFLIAPRHRAPILAFYRFARAADDVADHATLEPARKLALLDGLEACLLGHDDREPAALPLRSQLAARGLSPAHALDLLTAFRLDVTKQHYSDWDELMQYCRYSAAPVGRFVLDVHGESRACWPANDALCAALQVINHLQDCGRDYRTLGRVYLPLDVLRANGVAVEALAQPASSPGLAASLRSLAIRTASLLQEGAALSPCVRDLRLAVEVAVIDALAHKLVSLLQSRDPLGDRVHRGRATMLGTAAGAALAALARRLRGPAPRSVAEGGQR